jgi:broad specificity phosphatase PhoE
MTTFILIRHGEPRYDEIQSRGYKGMGYELGRLTDLGIKQAEERALDERLVKSQIIISSPYTRALQTAAIISRSTGIILVVENDLHEWMPDLTHHYTYDPHEAFLEYIENRGIVSQSSKFSFEPFDHLQKRVSAVLDRYQDYDKVIVVCHGIVISTQTHFDDIIEHCGVRVLVRS